uniref:Putative ovule protein n=1 Tax=Solanum chacoense TaxID=4108 RepID=A0A0V0GXT4_SOLCH
MKILVSTFVGLKPLDSFLVLIFYVTVVEFILYFLSYCSLWMILLGCHLCYILGFHFISFHFLFLVCITPFVHYRRMFKSNMNIGKWGLANDSCHLY